MKSNISKGDEGEKRKTDFFRSTRRGFCPKENSERVKYRYTNNKSKGASVLLFVDALRKAAATQRSF